MSLFKFPSVVDVARGWTWSKIAFLVSKVFFGYSKCSKLHHFSVVGANSAHMFPSEVNFDFFFAQLVVDVSQVILYMFIG